MAQRHITELPPRGQHFTWTVHVVYQKKALPKPLLSMLKWSNILFVYRLGSSLGVSLQAGGAFVLIHPVAFDLLLCNGHWVVKF